jgi:hypothetical protein
MCPVTTGFFVVAVAATVVAVLALIFDGVLEAFDLDLPGDGSVSLLALTGGIATFGWTGVLLQSTTDLPLWAVLLVATGVGLAVMTGGVLLTSMLRRQSAPDGAGSVTSLTGVTGVMDTPAAPGRPGVVRVSYSGSPRTLTAHAAVDVAAGALVTVADVVSPDVVRVTPADA